MPTHTPRVVIVGATGAVGREFLGVLERRRFPLASLRLFASARSAGQSLTFRGQPLRVEELSERSFDDADLALFSAGASVSRTFAPVAARAGCIVIDNSSAFRMDPAVPLVVPEINPHALAPLRGSLARSASQPRRGAIIANPNCSTIIMMLPLHPLRQAFGIERIVVSTYQAVSGAGASAMDELATQSREVLAGRAPVPRVFSEPCAFNVFSHNSAMDPATGRNLEEQKMIDESRKIWGDPSLRVAPTCIRVPTMRAHAESITVTLSTPATEQQVRDALAAAPGCELADDRARNAFPTPVKAAARDPVLVGRIRPDDSQDFSGPPGQRAFRGFSLFVCGDQLLKGAALNAVQIAELL